MLVHFSVDGLDMAAAHPVAFLQTPLEVGDDGPACFLCYATALCLDLLLELIDCTRSHGEHPVLQVTLEEEVGGAKIWGVRCPLIRRPERDQPSCEVVF